jgi:hypothetical protein
MGNFKLRIIVSTDATLEVVYPDGPPLLAAHQLEVGSQVGPLAEEAHFDDLGG